MKESWRKRCKAQLFSFCQRWWRWKYSLIISITLKEEGELMYQLWSIRRCWWRERSLCLALSLATHPLLLCPALTRFTWLFNNFKIKGGFLVDFLPMSLFSLQQAASGFIYPLERGLIFIYKPPIFVKYEDVQSINFARYENSLLELAWNDLTKNFRL